MSDEESILSKANEIMNGDTDSDYDVRRRNVLEEGNNYDQELKDKVGEKLKLIIVIVMYVLE